MFDDPFCQSPTFSRGLFESLSKLIFSSAEGPFPRRKVLSNKEVFFKEFWSWGKKVLDFWEKTGKIAKFVID